MRQLKKQTVKVRFRNINNNETDKWILSSHLVLAYGVWDDNTKIFLIVDRELNIIEPDDKGLEIVENNLVDYENFPELNYGKEFFVQKDFLEFVKQFESYHNFKSDSIWIKSKLNRFFNQNHFKIPTIYKDTILNESYKFGVIKGFLTYTNHDINKNNKGSSYRNCFYFNKSINLDTIVPERFKDDQHYKFERLDVVNYEGELLNFIEEKLYYNESKDIESDKYLIRDFFEIIDCLFLNKVEEIYKIKTFYDDMFVIKYEDKFYYLNYDWTS